MIDEILDALDEKFESLKEKLGSKPLKLIIISAIVITMITATYAAFLWQKQSELTVKEPFVISSDLPEKAILYAGTYNYKINVTNIGDKQYTATLTYTFTAVNVTATISPPSETSYIIPAGSMKTFAISITVELQDGKTEGKLTITWQITRN